MPRRLRVRDHRQAAALGVVLMGLGAWFLHDAYEGRGRNRPFAMKFLGSWG